jgi:hypothetical protein
VRKGGVIAFDNMLWGGAVADPKATDADTRGIRALNAKIAGDARVDSVLCLWATDDGGAARGLVKARAGSMAARLPASAGAAPQLILTRLTRHDAGGYAGSPRRVSMRESEADENGARDRRRG